MLNQKDYIYNKSKVFKSKSFKRKRTIIYTNEKGVAEEVELNEKVVLFWSQNCEKRMHYKRILMQEKIKKYKESQTILEKGNWFELKAYFNTKQIDKKTKKEVKTQTELVFD